MNTANYRTLRRGYRGEDVRDLQFRSLRRGYRGEDVRDLQFLLNYKLDINLVIDGKFGAKTQEAVIAFQRRQNLTPNGNVGFMTWIKLLKHPPRRYA